jgi:hypothetical protein
MMDRRSISYSKSIQPKKCTVVFVCACQTKLVYIKSLFDPTLCGIMWNRVMCPSSTRATQPPYPSHFRLSLAAALYID